MLAVAFIGGCEDRYDEGYRAGYADADAVAESRIESQKAALAVCEEERSEAIYDTGANYRSVTTTVCGGGGVNVSGKHISPGKTGCVRVYSDGTTERY